MNRARDRAGGTCFRIKELGLITHQQNNSRDLETTGQFSLGGVSEPDEKLDVTHSPFPVWR